MSCPGEQVFEAIGDERVILSRVDQYFEYKLSVNKPLGTGDPSLSLSNKCFLFCVFRGRGLKREATNRARLVICRCCTAGTCRDDASCNN